MRAVAKQNIMRSSSMAPSEPELNANILARPARLVWRTSPASTSLGIRRMTVLSDTPADSASSLLEYSKPLQFTSRSSSLAPAFPDTSHSISPTHRSSCPSFTAYARGAAAY